MNDQTDSQLLRAYAENGSEPAFAEVVRRHVDFVYSAALRMVCDSHLAKDVTQGVFVALAQNSGQLVDRAVLSSWLHRTAQNIAAQTVRTEVRRRIREQKAVAMNEILSAEPDTSWEDIAPHLDAALGQLNESDRDALLLRYFERKSAREIGQTFGISDEAAQKRVNRAIERLRELFTKRGFTIGAGSLVVVISTNAVQAAPAGLAADIFAATSLLKTTIALPAKAIAMTTLQKSLIAVVVVTAIGAGMYKAGQAHSDKTSLSETQQPLAEEIQNLRQERDNATNQIAGFQNKIAKLQPDQSELLRLRNEVAMLKQRTTELSNQVAKSSNKYGLLPEQMPPVQSTDVKETARAYAKLVKKSATGELTPAEEFNLAKGWPYLERRFGEPSEFGFFQSEYLATILDVKDTKTKWELRRILEKAREDEHAYGLSWARMPDEEVQSYKDLNIDIADTHQKWNELNKKSMQQIDALLTDAQRQKLATYSGNIMDFDTRLKSSPAAATDPRFQNLGGQEVFDAFLPAEPGVRYVPATPLTKSN